MGYIAGFLAAVFIASVIVSAVPQEGGLGGAEHGEEHEVLTGGDEDPAEYPQDGH
jgi:hypothetical protein